LEGLVVIDIAPVTYKSNDGSMWEVIQKVIESCASLDAGVVGSKKEADGILREGGIEDGNLRGFICTNLEKGEGGGMRWKVGKAGAQAGAQAGAKRQQHNA